MRYNMLESILGSTYFGKSPSAEVMMWPPHFLAHPVDPQLRPLLGQHKVEDSRRPECC